MLRPEAWIKETAPASQSSYHRTNKDNSRGASASKPLFGNEWVQVTGPRGSLTRGTAPVKGLSVCVHFLDPVDRMHMKFLGAGADAGLRGAQPQVSENGVEG